MTRSGYSDECDGWALIRWRGAVKSAMRGKRGQAMLRELVEALDALPEKRLVADSLATPAGDCCALGALGLARGLDMGPIDPEDRHAVAHAFGVADALTAEVMFENDECAANEWRTDRVVVCGPMRPYYPDFGSHTRTVRIRNERAAEQRWEYMRAWAVAHLAPQTGGGN